MKFEKSIILVSCLLFAVIFGFNVKNAKKIKQDDTTSKTSSVTTQANSTATNSTNSTSTSNATDSATTVNTFNYDTDCEVKRFVYEQTILQAYCKDATTGEKHLIKFNLNACIDFKDNQLQKHSSGGKGIKKICSGIILAKKLILNCKNKDDPVGISFTNVKVNDYVTLIDNKPYCK
jgi:hypothetical protein